MGIVTECQSRRHHDGTPRGDRLRRAALFDQYRDLPAQGRSLRQAAQALEVPRRTLQAWRVHQESLDEHPAVVAFFHRAPGLAFLHRLVLGMHLVCTEVGAWGMRLGCRLGQHTGLDRFVAASYTYCMSRVISLVARSCGYDRGQIEQLIAHELVVHWATHGGLAERP